MGKLIKTQLKNGKYLYETITEDGERIKLRTSTREYKMCTADGSFFSSRQDLVEKGDHGKQVQELRKRLADPDKAYNNLVDSYKSCGVEIDITKEKYIASRKEQLKTLTTILYL